jgi:hypothetical protein
MQKQWLSRRPWLPSTLTWLGWALGVLWRWFHLTTWHDPRRFTHADLPDYVTLAKRLAQPGYVLTAGDVPTPPGITWLLEFFLRRDASLLQYVHFNFVVCALVPLAIGALGWVAFGKRTAQAAVVVASLSFALIDCGAYLTPDVHLALAGTLTLASYLQAMKLAGDAPSPKRTAAFFGLAALSGLLFSLALALSLVALPAVLGFCAVHFLFTHGPAPRRKALVLAAFLVAAAPLTGKVAARCTAANGGHVCLSANTTQAAFLLGHYDRTGALEWHDPAKPGDVAVLSNLGAQQHGFRATKGVAFAITDQENNAAYAWSWIRQNPGKAFVLSLEHVWDSLCGTYPWPVHLVDQWALGYGSHFLFLVFALLPALTVLADLLRQRGLLGLLRSMEFAVVSPIFGVCAAAFATTGQARSRVPWDGVLLVLAVQFYRRLKPGLEAPRVDAGELQQAERRIRTTLLVLGAAAIVGAVSGLVWALPDGHRFRASSGAWGYPATGTVGDHGDRGLFFHTAEEESPWVEIDLGELRAIDRVMVENRDDLAADRAVPLVVELGDPERHYHEVARRVDVFDRWTATFPKQQARYVRLLVPRKTILHLKNVQAQ